MIENAILYSLINNDEYARKVIPYLKSEYFQNHSERIVFDVIKNYIAKYNAIPNIQAVKIDLLNHKDLNEHLAKECQAIVDDYSNEDFKLDWLLVNTETFCKEQGLLNALNKSIFIYADKEKGQEKRGSIPQLLSDALAISFDNHVGHDFLEDWEERFDFYHSEEYKVPFDLVLLNKVTKGGVAKGTLNILMGGVHFGKTMCMSHMAAGNLRNGKNVLYITMEMAEEEISKRIDANLLDVVLGDIEILTKPIYQKKHENIRSKTVGKLIIKQYPTAMAGADNFRHLLNELKLKKNFVPDIIYIDYLNICKSSRIKYTASVGLYEYVKSIAEELRGLAVEEQVPIISATQVNRIGFTETDPDMSHTSESFGLPGTADLMWVILVTEELKSMNQIAIKQLKNRYHDKDYMTKFVLGCDRGKQRLYEVSNDSYTPPPVQAPQSKKNKKQLPVNEPDTPVFDKTTAGTKFDQAKFKDWK